MLRGEYFFAIMVSSGEIALENNKNRFNFIGECKINFELNKMNVMKKIDN